MNDCDRKERNKRFKLLIYKAISIIWIVGGSIGVAVALIYWESFSNPDDILTSSTLIVFAGILWFPQIPDFTSF